MQSTTASIHYKLVQRGAVLLFST